MRLMRRVGVWAVLVCLWLPGVASAQTVQATKLTVGGSELPPSGTSVRLDGLGTSGGTNVLFADGDGDIFERLLGVSDIPSAFTRDDVAETVTQPWTFSGGIVGPLSVTTSLSSPLGYFSTRVETPALTTGAGALGISAANGLVSWGAGVTAVNPTTALRTSLGTPQIPYGALSVGELKASAFVANYTQAYTEASLRVGRGSKTTRALGASDTVLFVDRASYRYLDYLTLRTLDSTGMPQFEILRVVSAQHYDCTGATSPLPSNCGGVDNNDYAYVVERNKDATGANAWEVGTAAVVRDRWIEMYSEGPGSLSYGSAVLADRPLAYWNFDAGVSPTPNRASGYVGYVGARTALSTASGATASGGGGYAGAEDPATNYGAFYRGTSGSLVNAVSVPETETVATAYAFTLELLYYGSAGTAYAVQPVSRWDTTTSNANFVLYHFGDAAGSDDGKIAVFGNHNGTFVDLTGRAAISDNVWTHIVATWDSDNGGKLYVNGTLVSSVASAAVGQPVNGYTQQIRSTVGAGGHISELAIYDRVLDAQAVVAHYRALTVARPSLAYGPTIAGHVQTSTSNWYDTEPRWAAGNLAGLYGYGDETFGFAAGDPSATYITAEATNGFRILGPSNAVKFHAKTNGDIDLSGNLNLVSGGDIKSASAFSLTAAGGLLFETAASVSDFPRMIRWNGGPSVWGSSGTLTVSAGTTTTLVVGGIGSDNAATIRPGTSSTTGDRQIGVSGNGWTHLWLSPPTQSTMSSSRYLLIADTDGGVKQLTDGFTGACSGPPLSVINGLIISC